ncbi:MAG TPA: hypothetical protein DEF07_10030 [Nitrosomonas sp.]|nr:hypothetical protein [Nitrosomonas sp.]
MLTRHTYSLKWFLKIEGWYILFFIIYGSAICILNLHPFFEDYTLPASAIGFLGTAVAILLGFRNNSAYERFWEARKAWGDLTNASRYFASQVITYKTRRKIRLIFPTFIKKYSFGIWPL